MPLQIRRGTDAERLGSFTPAEGELIYTTDTKKLYVGDGITPGGVAIDTVGGGGGASVLGDLTDVSGAVPTVGQVLKWDGTNWVPDTDTSGMSALTDDSSPALGGQLDLNSSSITGIGNIYITGDISTAGDVTGNVMYGDFHGSLFGDVFADDSTTKLVNATTQSFAGDITGSVKSSNTGNTVVDTSGPNAQYTGSVKSSNTGNTVVDTSGITSIYTGNVVGNVTGTLTGVLTGDVTGNVTGSVFSDNSSLVIDGGDASIYTAKVRARLNKIDMFGDTAATPLDLNFFSDAAEPGRVNFTRKDITADLSLDTISNGRITFGREDINGSVTTSFINGRNDCLFLFADSTGNSADVASYVTLKDQKLGIGTVAPAEELDVQGNAVVTGFVQFGSLTTAERDALTAANGMVIYNTTDNKFQGRENGVWVNLV